MYKNAKKTQTTKGASAMQPAATGLDGTGVKLMKGDHNEARVNEDAFVKKREADVPVDEVFFHKFFSRKSERNQKKGGKNDEDSDEEEDEEEEGDGEGAGSDEEMDLTGDEAAAVGQEGEDDSDDEEEDEVWKVCLVLAHCVGV